MSRKSEKEALLGKSNARYESVPTDDHSNDDDEIDEIRPRDSGLVSQVKNQITDVMDVMQANINKVIERGERIDDLAVKTDRLAERSVAFRRKAQDVRQQMWFKNIRLKVFIVFFVIIILAAILVPIIIQATNKQNGGN